MKYPTNQIKNIFEAIIEVIYRKLGIIYINIIFYIMYKLQ